MKLFLYCFRDFDEKVHFEALQKEYDFTYRVTEAYPDMANASLAEGFEAISVTPTRLDRALLERFRALGVRYILNRSIGVDHVDLQAARELGLRVACVSYEPQAVANYAIMLMLMSLRKILHILERSALGDFGLKGKLGRDISSCTVGVIGTGRIGETVIRHLQPFGCRILAYSSRENPALANLCEYVELETLYRQSEVISLHLPLNDSSFHLLNNLAFAQMRQGVIIINTARGALIDTDDLIVALAEGKVGGAALDVLEHEEELYSSNRVGDDIANRQLTRLRAFPNVTLSSHTAFYTDEVVRSMAEKTVRNLFDLKNGRENPLLII
ncbi:MAG: NAD(P)-dependent oxidoreductase [Desulfopila sp.]